ncbi:hypothetical protein Patl1_07084 [Pistacia atlantica]|uniref:Uncharacterized protein n=1 Tax=Pistacia atlantica TaxID=434234 RepID=A0ACC1AK54_9ROSI|nr:hypothetical protein Patl1_07084 [Pistacia atlantica]
MCLDTSIAIPFNVLCNLKILETLEIRSCDSLKEVFDMQGQLNADGHTLKKSHQEVLDFKNLKSFKVGFRNFEHLKLSEFPTSEERFWNGKVLASLFYSLKFLVLDMCLDTSIAIPFNVMCNLKNLETLEIRSCDSLKEVFDMQGQLNADGHTLKKSHQEVLDFKNLKSCKVHNCCNLRRIFTPSIILGLVQLQEIEVKNCALIEEIILKEEEKEADIEKIMILQLNSVILESLPNLTSFYSVMKTLECPALKAIIVVECLQIETLVFTYMKHQSDHVAPLFSEKMKSLFPVSIATDLMQLKEFQIRVMWAGGNCYHGGSRWDP